jgi:hemoglobin
VSVFDPPEGSAFDRVGGEWPLRAVIGDFIDRCFNDAMIGFMFQRADRDRIKEMEFQLAAQLLGGPFRYQGRPLAEAHRPHRIQGGQFERRKFLLELSLRAHNVPHDIEKILMDHTDRMRGQVTIDADSNCSGG